MIGTSEIPLSLIVVGGKAPDVFEMPPYPYARIIAADSGYDTACRLSIVPDLAVGDFDSTEYINFVVEKEYKRAPRDKNESDMELALMEIEGGYDLLGGGEGRFDHLMYIITLFRKYGVPRFWFTKEDAIIGVNSHIELDLPIGINVSIIPLGEAHVTTAGLLWELSNAYLGPEFMSLSNRNKDRRVIIDTDAPVLVRIDKDAFSWSCINS